MNSYFDFASVMQHKLNAEMKKEEALKPIVEVLNKYGIYGSKVFDFLGDFATACQRAKSDQEELY